MAKVLRILKKLYPGIKQFKLREMKETSIEEKNRIIAEFMGGVFSDTYNSAPKNIPVFGLDANSVEKLKYHSSWDWLMPVVQKINSLYNPRIYKAYEERPSAWDVIDLTITNTIDEVFDSIFQFITWYNSQIK